jgi:holin-like protein
MFRQLAIIIGCLAVGEFIVWLTGITVPSSILGMLLLTLLLKIKVVKLEWVETISNFLVKNMGFFFVPPGVALMLYFDIIKAEIGPIVLATAISTILVLVVTGWTHIATRKVINRIKTTIRKGKI